MRTDALVCCPDGSICASTAKRRCRLPVQWNTPFDELCCAMACTCLFAVCASSFCTILKFRLRSEPHFCTTWNLYTCPNWDPLGVRTALYPRCNERALQL